MASVLTYIQASVATVAVDISVNTVRLKSMSARLNHALTTLPAMISAIILLVNALRGSQGGTVISTLMTA